MAGGLDSVSLHGPEGPVPVIPVLHFHLDLFHLVDEFSHDFRLLVNNAFSFFSRGA